MTSLYELEKHINTMLGTETITRPTISPDEDRDEDILPTENDPDISEDEDKGANIEDLKEVYN